MRFAKLHGLGNDFLLIDLRGAGDGCAQPGAGGGGLSAAEVRALCDRHTGVGADGILTLTSSASADAKMIIQNADGSVPEMCGNGARCAALWIATGRCTREGSGRVLLETAAGIRPCAVVAEGPARGSVEVEMGVPRVEAQRIFAVAGEQIRATPVAVGNPHLVIFIDRPGEFRSEVADSREQLASLAVTAGRALCAAENANVEFALRLAPQHYLVAVWERGAGLTRACGTGACGVAAAAISGGHANAHEPIAIELPGGSLHIELDPGTGQLRMRGPAELIYRGET